MGRETSCIDTCRKQRIGSLVHLVCTIHVDSVQSSISVTRRKSDRCTRDGFAADQITAATKHNATAIITLVPFDIVLSWKAEWLFFNTRRGFFTYLRER